MAHGNINRISCNDIHPQLKLNVEEIFALLAAIELIQIKYIPFQEIFDSEKNVTFVDENWTCLHYSNLVTSSLNCVAKRDRYAYYR